MFTEWGVFLCEYKSRYAEFFQSVCSIYAALIIFERSWINLSTSPFALGHQGVIL